MLEATPLYLSSRWRCKQFPGVFVCQRKRESVFSLLAFSFICRSPSSAGQAKPMGVQRSLFLTKNIKTAYF
jgi:hypothetical protein